MRRILSATLAVFLMAGFANAQDLGSTLAKVAQPYAQAYVAPAVDAFGMDMNSGLFHDANVGGTLPFGLHLYIGVQAGAALIPNSDKSFTLAYQDSVYNNLINKWQQLTDSVVDAPTIFGPTGQKGVIKPYLGNTPLTPDSTIQGLVHASIAPIPIPQVSLGSLFGTDVMVRWLPQIKISNYGKLQLFGWALRHSVSQYIPLIPVDIAVQLGFQNLAIKDTAGNNVFKLSTFAANVEISKTLAILTLYGGLQVESSKVDIAYSITPPPTAIDPNPSPIPISFSLKGKNKFRALAGLDLGLGPLTINADYSLGAVDAVTVGLGISI